MQMPHNKPDIMFEELLQDLPEDILELCRGFHFRFSNGRRASPDPPPNRQLPITLRGCTFRRVLRRPARYRSDGILLQSLSAGGVWSAGE